MNILYFTQFYTPENNAGSFRARDHANAWSNNGENVTVFTGWPNYPAGKVFEGYEVKLLAEETDENVRVLRSKITAKPNTNFFRRIQSGSSFLAFGVWNSLVNGKRIGSDYDVIFASSGSVFAGCLGYIYARKLKKPFVIEFRDITFVQMMATGTPKRSWKAQLMRSLEVGLAKRARRVVVVTQGLKDTLVQNAIPVDKIDVIPNGADIVDLGLAFNHDDPVFGYYGTMGISQDVAGTLDLVASLYNQFPDLEYRLIGEGAAKSEVQKALSRGAYPFAHILAGMPKSELEAHYRNTDMCIVSLRRDDLFSSSIPSKIFQSLARGVPVLFIGPSGEASQLLIDGEAGIALVGTPEENKRALSSFFGQSDWPNLLREMGRNGMDFMQKNFSRQQLAQDVLRTLHAAVGECERRP